MAAKFLPQHSSNPLEVADSDYRNKSFVRTYKQAIIDRSQISSDDAISGAADTEVHEYQHHIETLIGPLPGKGSTTKSTSKRRLPAGLVDLDSSDSSDEDEDKMDEEDEGQDSDNDEDEMEEEEEVEDDVDLAEDEDLGPDIDVEEVEEENSI